MEIKYNILVIISIFVAIFLQQFGESATLVVDGVSEWKNPTVQVGDSIIFRHKYNYNLYIFKNRRAFNLCNFTESTLLTSSGPTYTWHPSRLGSFYFAFQNATTKACDNGQKLAIQVSSTLTPESPSSPSPPQPPSAAPSPQPGSSVGGSGGDIISSTPPPTISIGDGGIGGGGIGGGGIVSSSPSYPWPNRPQELVSPSPSPMNAIFPSNGPMLGRGKSGGSLPFINSNPAVPLPTGEVDSATIRPAANSKAHTLQIVGFVGVVKALCWMVFLVVLQ